MLAVLSPVFLSTKIKNNKNEKKGCVFNVHTGTKNPALTGSILIEFHNKIRFFFYTRIIQNMLQCVGVQGSAKIEIRLSFFSRWK